MSRLEPQSSQLKLQKPPQDVCSQPASTKEQLTAPKPDKNVSVPKYIRLNEGCDPKKFIKR
jgi:hypothetical protein